MFNKLNSAKIYDQSFMPKVFLGGTYNNSTWRGELIPTLKIESYNPVVDDWTPECQEEEIRQREVCDYCLYTITPEMKGVYSIAEAVEDSVRRPHKTILCVLEEANGKRFDESEMKSLKQVGAMVKANGGSVFYNLEDVTKYLNSRGEL